MIRAEWRRLVCAVQFLTCLPTPGVQWTDDMLARATRWFPLVGAGVGGLCGLVLIAAHQVWAQGPLPAVLAVCAGVALTGALHEDGLADTADGLGGGREPLRRLAIMKDSRVGTYGLLALGLSMAVKVCALAAIGSPFWALAVLVCAHAGGRAAAVAMMRWTPYAADPEASKLAAAGREVGAWDAALAIGTGGAFFLLLTPAAALACLAGGVVAAAIPALAARRLIGGHTGDILGAVEQAFELGVVLAAGAVWSLGAL